MVDNSAQGFQNSGELPVRDGQPDCRVTDFFSYYFDKFWVSWKLWDIIQNKWQDNPQPFNDHEILLSSILVVYIIVKTTWILGPFNA